MGQNAYIGTLALTMVGFATFSCSSDSGDNGLFDSNGTDGSADVALGGATGSGGTSSGGTRSSTGGSSGSSSGGSIIYPVDASADSGDVPADAADVDSGSLGSDASSSSDAAGASDAEAPPASCEGDGDCSPPNRFCAVSEGTCVSCLSDNHCTDGRTCDPVTHTCTFACNDSSDCVDPRPYCEPERRVCVACLTDTNCGTERRPLCHPERNECVQCVENTDCTCLLPPALAPCCSRNNTCSCGVLVCL